MLEIRDLRHEYAGRTVLAVPAWEVAQGDASLVLGPSGSGKTTLLNVIAGLTTPTAGTVRVGNEDVTRLAPARRDAFRARNVGLVLQTLHLIGVVSVRENLRLAQSLAGAAVDEARIDEVLAMLGITSLAAARARELSLGEAQRVAIAPAVLDRHLPYPVSGGSAVRPFANCRTAGLSNSRTFSVILSLSGALLNFQHLMKPGWSSHARKYLACRTVPNIGGHDAKDRRNLMRNSERRTPADTVDGRPINKVCRHFFEKGTDAARKEAQISTRQGWKPKPPDLDTWLDELVLRYKVWWPARKRHVVPGAKMIAAESSSALRWRQMVNQGWTELGLPEPETDTERAINRTGELSLGALFGVGAARQLAERGVTSGSDLLVRFLATNPKQQVAADTVAPVAGASLALSAQAFKGARLNPEDVPQAVLRAGKIILDLSVRQRRRCSLRALAAD